MIWKQDCVNNFSKLYKVWLSNAYSFQPELKSMNYFNVTDFRWKIEWVRDCLQISFNAKQI